MGYEKVTTAYRATYVFYSILCHHVQSSNAPPVSIPEEPQKQAGKPVYTPLEPKMILYVTGKVVDMVYDLEEELRGKAEPWKLIFHIRNFTNGLVDRGDYHLNLYEQHYSSCLTVTLAQHGCRSGCSVKRTIGCTVGFVSLEVSIPWSANGSSYLLINISDSTSRHKDMACIYFVGIEHLE